jgi:hypothetical protein
MLLWFELFKISQFLVQKSITFIFSALQGWLSMLRAVKARHDVKQRQNTNPTKVKVTVILEL